ncbi:MAG: hypothetical protein WCS96_07190 [Victivallales bacterium]|jgi:ABC-type uncharacterized transport system auxiliary subunit
MRNVFACVLFALVLCGCGIFSREPYRGVNYYDFDCKAEKKYGIGVNVSEITADRPYSDKMVFRISGNRIEIDEFNRWAGSPSELVKKYFTLSFENKASVKPSDYIMKAEIMQLEADLNKASVNLMMQISIRAVQKDVIVVQKVYREEIPVVKVTGESFARGVETALGKISDELSRDVQSAK